MLRAKAAKQRRQPRVLHMPSTPSPNPQPAQRTTPSLLPDGAAPLSAAGVAHGDMIFMLYHFERQVR
jgi:hypothetical protein